jgi:hypothetical protein
VAACSCLAASLEDHASYADRVFQGTAVWSSNQEGGRVTLFQVERAWKGQPRLSAYLFGSPGNSCYFHFEVGQSYIAFAEDYEEWEYAEWPQGMSRTANCIGTHPYDPDSGFDDRLRAGVPLEPVRLALATFGFGR